MPEISPMIVTLILVGAGFLILLVLLSMFNKFLVKSEPGQALVKTGFGAPRPKIYLSSAFVLPLLHRIDTIDLTVKTVRIDRRKEESLSCADGIRAEIERHDDTDREQTKAQTKNRRPGALAGHHTPEQKLRGAPQRSEIRSLEHSANR